MPFEKGKPKTGGRPTGSISKIQYTARAKIMEVINGYLTDDEVKGWVDDLAKMRPVDRDKSMSTWAKYAMPTIGSLKIENDADSPINIRISYSSEAPKTDEDETDLDYSVEL